METLYPILPRSLLFPLPSGPWHWQKKHFPGAHGPRPAKRAAPGPNALDAFPGAAGPASGAYPDTPASLSKLSGDDDLSMTTCRNRGLDELLKTSTFSVFKGLLQKLKTRGHRRYRETRIPPDDRKTRSPLKDRENTSQSSERTRRHSVVHRELGLSMYVESADRNGLDQLTEFSRY